MSKKILFVDMDNVLVDFPAALAQLPPEVLHEYEGRLDEVPSIFALMSPMPEAIESYTELSERFDTYILSTAPWGNPSAWSDKLLWVQKHLGNHAYKRLILSHHKHLCAGDFLIDDRLKNGADKFKGELILFGSEQFASWAQVMAYMRTVA